ncbi:MAG: winged helix DNA-binding protein [Blautia sp.]|nr:winged helix DNA-binding protein [Blautia sp.]
MTVESVKKLIDICAAGSRLEEYFPALPEGITPRCVRVIEQLALLEEKGELVRVSDISEMLDVTKPGITAVLRALAEKGYVTKRRDEKDNRVVYVALTDSGKKIYRQYVVEYHSHLSTVLSPLTDQDALEAERIITLLLSLVKEDKDQRETKAKTP